MKTFTIEEAERILPKVECLVKKAQTLREKIAWLLETNDGPVEVNDEFGFHFFLTENVQVNKEFHRLYYQFYKNIEALNELGVIMKDIELGLVDFPFKVKNSEAFLCWQLGEDKISYWHDCEEDFENRHKIVDMDELFKK